MGDMADDHANLFDEDAYEAYKSKRNKSMKKNYGNVADLEKETLVVEFSANGQWGPYIKANGEFIGLNEPLTEADFLKGQEYTVLIKRSKPTEKNPQGKKYIAQIVGDGKATEAKSAVAAAPRAAYQAPAAPSAAKQEYADKEAAKNSRILWQGVIQALAQSPVYAALEHGEAFTSAIKADAENLVAFILTKAGA